MHCLVVINSNIFHLDEDFATRFGDEFWERLESITSALTHVNLQRWNVNTTTSQSSEVGYKMIRHIWHSSVWSNEGDICNSIFIPRPNYVSCQSVRRSVSHIDQGRSDGGGVYRYIYPPNQSTFNFLCGCFVCLIHLYPPKWNSCLRLWHWPRSPNLNTIASRTNRFEIEPSTQQTHNQSLTVR